MKNAQNLDSHNHSSSAAMEMGYKLHHSVCTDRSDFVNEGLNYEKLPLKRVLLFLANIFEGPALVVLDADQQVIASLLLSI